MIINLDIDNYGAIREEPIKLAQYLRSEKESYEPIKAIL